MLAEGNGVGGGTVASVGAGELLGWLADGIGLEDVQPATTTRSAIAASRAGMARL